MKFSNVHVKKIINVDTKDLYQALSSTPNTIEKSVVYDLNTMMFYFETFVGIFAWIGISLNPAYVGTKFDSQLTNMLVLSLEIGMLQIYLTKCEFRRWEKSFG